MSYPEEDPSMLDLAQHDPHVHHEQMPEMTLAAGMGDDHQATIMHQLAIDHARPPLVLDPTLHSNEEQQPIPQRTNAEIEAAHYQTVLFGESPPIGPYHVSYVRPAHQTYANQIMPNLPTFPELPPPVLSHPTLDQMADGSTIPPPRPIETEDLETLVARINHHGAEHGYAVRKCQSRYKEGPNGTKVCERTYLVCDKSGKHRDTHGYMNVQKGGEGRKRRAKDGAPLPAATKRIDCPFKLYARAVDGVWKWEPRNINHNHAPAVGVESRLHRKLNATQTVQASEWLDQGVRPHQVLLQLQELAAQANEPCYASIKEVYNLKRLLNSYRRRGRDAHVVGNDEHVVDSQLEMVAHDQMEAHDPMAEHERMEVHVPMEIHEPQEMTLERATLEQASLEQAHIGI